jgi:hypothetical protein
MKFLKTKKIKCACVLACYMIKMKTKDPPNILSMSDLEPFEENKTSGIFLDQ